MGLVTSLPDPKLAVFFVALFPQFLMRGTAVLPYGSAMAATVVALGLPAMSPVNRWPPVPDGPARPISRRAPRHQEDHAYEHRTLVVGVHEQVQAPPHRLRNGCACPTLRMRVGPG